MTGRRSREPKRQMESANGWMKGSNSSSRRQAGGDPKPKHIIHPKPNQNRPNNKQKHMNDDDPNAPTHKHTHVRVRIPIRRQIHAQPMPMTEHRDTILTHTHSYARVLKRYANKIATATTRANNIPTAAAAAAGQLCGEFARIMRISNTHTHSEKHSQSYTPIHPYTCTCILNTCFVLVAVFVIIAVAGHSRHHGCCCCCSIHSFCCIYATRVRYISQSVAGVLPDFAFQPTRLPFYVAIRSTTQLIKLTSIHSNSNYNNNNNNNFFYQLQKVIVSSIVPCFSFSSFAFLF